MQEGSGVEKLSCAAHLKIEVLVLHAFYVAAHCWRGDHCLAQVQPVQRRGLARIVQANLHTTDECANRFEVV